MFAVFSSLQTPMSDGKFEAMVRFLSLTVPWFFVEKIKAATMRYGFTWHLLTVVETMHHEISTINAFFLKNGPLRTELVRKKDGHTEIKKTIRNRLRRPYASMIDNKMQQGGPCIKMFEE